MYTVYLAVLLAFISCSKDLDVEVNTNPYDSDYVGDVPVSIVSIASEQWYSFGDGNTYERIRVTVNASIEDYTSINLYRDGNKVSSSYLGLVLFDYKSASWSLASPLLPGTTYSFQASLAKGGGETNLSPAYTFLIN